MPRYALLVLLVLLLGVAFHLLGIDGGTRNAGSIDVDVLDIEAAAGADGVQAQLASPRRLPIEPQVSVGSFLREYWGADWPGVEKEYLRRDVNLDAPVASDQFKPWEEVKEEAQATARSYYERDRAFRRRTFLGTSEEIDEKLLGQFGMTETNRDEVMSGLGEAIDEIDLELERLCERYVFELDSAMMRTFAQQPDRYPLADLRSKKERSGSTLGIQVETGGWFVSYRCNYADFPLLEDIDKKREVLMGQRFHRMKELVRRSRN